MWKWWSLNHQQRGLSPPPPFFFLTHLHPVGVNQFMSRVGGSKRLEMWRPHPLLLYVHLHLCFPDRVCPETKGNEERRWAPKTFSRYKVIVHPIITRKCPAVYVIRNASRSWKFTSTLSKSCTWPILSGFCIIEFAVLTELYIFYLLTCGYVAFRAKLWHHVLFYEVFG